MKKILILIAFLSLFSSCADLDGLAPINSIPTDQAITDLASAQAALNGVYDAMQAVNEFDLWLALPQFFSDEADATGTFPERLEFGNLNVQTSNIGLSNIFSDLYLIINNANNVIALVPGVEDPTFSEEAKNDIIAQAKFLRGHCYLHLVTLWQEVPLILTPTEEVGQVLNVVKSSSDEIYRQAILDFTDAEANLLAETGPNTASKQAANAFLARIALYQERWADAINFAELALGQGFDLTQFPFLDDQIYSLAYTATDGNALNFFYGPPELGGRYSIGPSMQLISAFENGDQRLPKTLDLNTSNVPFGVKYPSFESGGAGTATDPIFFIRHAEMVLIIAESLAEQGDFDTATAWYNQVRVRAGLNEFGLSSDNFVDLILQERFVEFAFEGPFRLIDLRRKGKALDVLGPIGYDACDNIWPLPQREIDRNPNLIQNGCCNC